MTFLFAAIGPYIPNGGEGFGAAVAFTFLLVIGIASIRKIKKNKKKADEYIYNHLTAEEKEEFENKKIKDKEFADNSRYEKYSYVSDCNITYTITICINGSNGIYRIHSKKCS